MPVLYAYPELPALNSAFYPNELAFTSSDFSWYGTDWRVTAPVPGTWYSISPQVAINSAHVTRLAFVAGTSLETGLAFSVRLKAPGGAVLATLSGVADAVSPCWGGRTCVFGSRAFDFSGIDAPDGIGSIEVKVDSGSASYLVFTGGGGTGEIQYDASLGPFLTAGDDEFETNEDEALSGSVASNDSTTSGGTLTFAKTTDPSHGAVTFNSDGSFVYTPAPDYNGSDSFTYTVTDPVSSESLTRAVNITIHPMPDTVVYLGPPPEWPENTRLVPPCGGGITAEKLVNHLNRPFDHSPQPDLLLRLRYDGTMSWSVYAGRLKTDVAGGSGVNLDVDLSGVTVGELSDHLAAQPGYTIEYENPAYGSYSALMLLDGAGNQDASNGDHLLGATTILWAYMAMLAWELTAAKRQICEMLHQMEIPSAEDIWLDHLGGYYKVPRLQGEPDRAYGPRIIAETLMPKGNNYAICAAIERAIGQRCEVVDVVEQFTVPTFYYNEDYSYNEEISYSGGGGSGIRRCLFDVLIGYDLLGMAEPVSYRDQIIAQVNRLRDAGTFLRQITLAASSDFVDDRPVGIPPSDELTISVVVEAYYDDTYRHDEVITYGGEALAIESL